jgi:phosphatidylglycerol---prolipoprotein diacylglyceryl transferase
MAPTLLPLAVIKINLDPVLVHLGPIAVHWYGLMYVVGLAVGMYVMVPFAEKLGFSRDIAYELFWPILIGSLVGGRLYYVVQSDIGYYLRHPQDIIATWEGGMAFYGAVFGGTLAAYIACRLRSLSFPRILDAATILIPIAQAFGRIGNIVNGDILGYASNVPWATQYTNSSNTFVPSHNIAYQPAAAYELLFSLGLFALVYALRFRFTVPGTLFTFWLVTYSIGQFLLFFLRNNPVVFLGLKQAQVTAMVVVLITIPAWLLWKQYWLTKGGAREGERLPEAPQAEALGQG